MKLTTILVVDDSVTIRAMLEVLLEQDRSLRIVGIAGDAEETFELIRETDPDVVTLDIAMPGMDGMAVLERIMKEEPRPVIMLSALMREGDPLPVDARKLSPATFVGCVVTQPSVPPLIAAARERGCATMTGAGMFEAVRERLVDFYLALYRSAA